MPEKITVIESGPPGSFERFLDTLANYLANPPVFTSQQPDTTVVHWIIGDIGMGPVPGLPVGFLSPLNDQIVPFGKGGSTGGRMGTDMDEFTVPILVIQSERKPAEYPVASTQPGASEYLEEPGTRALLNLVASIRKALRVDPTFGGAVATSTITELRPMLIDLDNKVYRGARLTIAARARRSRG